ncbi:hypothetical protein EDB83DRAFT_272425 [Lactarius deliciosus]|nr:hypothetical protein EDB83DRAFT_272425 [Lactarius deliciosus]
MVLLQTTIVVCLLSLRWGDADLDLCSVPRVGLRNGELKHCAAHSGKLARVNEDHACRIYNQRVIPRGGCQGRLCEGSYGILAPIEQSSLTPRCIRRSFFRAPESRCESGTYHAFLLARPQVARKEDCWMDVVGTKEKPNGHYLATFQEHGQLVVRSVAPVIPKLELKAGFEYNTTCQNSKLANKCTLFCPPKHSTVR